MRPAVVTGAPLLTCVLFLAVLANQPSWARPFGAELTGEEILVEAEKLSPGDGTAGIWAISGDADPQLLIPLGRYPRWSPDHTKFGFMRGKELWAADRVAGVSLQLVGGEPRLAGAPSTTVVAIPTDGTADGTRFMKRPGAHLRCVGLD